MQSVSVSACIVTCNSMDSIKTTLDTIFENIGNLNFLLYVVDNMSTDGTPEFIKENYPQVCVLEPMTNKGFGAGHNLVIPMISSKYHIVINPDIILKDNAIEQMIDFMEAHDEIGLLSPKICFPKGNEQILGKRNPKLKYLIASRMRGKEPSKLLKKYAMLDENIDEPTDIENASGCFMFFRTDLFRQLGGFDEKYFMYFEDCDISRRIAKYARVVYYPYATIYHVWGRGSKRNTKLKLIHLQSMFRYFIKWKTI